MTTRLSFEWKVEEIDHPDHYNRRMCRVTETDHREDSDRIFVMPCMMTEHFIIARRQRVAKEMRDDGNFNIDELYDLPLK